MEDVNLARWSAEFEDLMGRIGPRFSRSEPRERVRDYVAGLLSGLQRKNSWWIAEHAGESGPDGMQRLLRKARFDVEEIRNDLNGYVAERLGEPDGVLILDETWFVKKGRASVGVARQYSGTAGRIENSQIAVFAAYASSKGHVLVDHELYLPKDWTEDPDRCAAAGVPAERIAAGTVTKPRLAQTIIERADDAGLPFRWVTADAAYGSAKYLRFWLEQRDQFHTDRLLHLLRAEAIELTDLAWIAGTRWKVEECFQQAKDACGLDQYQARTWRAWHAHTTFAMIANALLSIARSAGHEKGAPRPPTRSASR
jgi:SRSO17 transposase